MAENKSTESFLLKKKLFFTRLSLAYIREMRLLIRGGKLTKRDGWRNVVEHCIVQAAESAVLAELLNLSVKDTERLMTAAACHDWSKRLDRKPSDFSKTERDRAEGFLEQVSPDPLLLAATGPEFLERALVDGESSFLERLQFYIDDITKGSEIVSFDERIDEVEARRQDLNEDVGLTAKLGAPYWTRERELGHSVAREIFERLEFCGAVISSPKDIPVLVNQVIQRLILEEPS